MGDDQSTAVVAAAVQEAAAALIRLVDIDATSGAEAAITDGFEALGRDLGLPVSRWPVTAGRENIIFGSAKPRLVFCTHMDTVPPHIPSRRVAGGSDGDDLGAIYGRGAADAAGVAVAMAYAAKALSDLGLADDVACWFVVGEETDHAGAKALLHYPDPPSIVILGEPCGGLPVRGQKGLLKLKVTASGTAAHSAYPELGASATHALMRALVAVLDADLPQDTEALGETTVNIGILEGGLAANVVAPSASAVVLIRCAAPVDAISTAVASAIGEAAGPSVTIAELNRAEPLEFLADAATLGEMKTGPPVPFNTDAHTLGPLQAKLLLMGPGDMRCCHGPDEHLSIADLGRAITDYTTVAQRLLR